MWSPTWLLIYFGPNTSEQRGIVIVRRFPVEKKESKVQLHTCYEQDRSIFLVFDALGWEALIHYNAVDHLLFA